MEDHRVIALPLITNNRWCGISLWSRRHITPVYRVGEQLLFTSHKLHGLLILLEMYEMSSILLSDNLPGFGHSWTNDWVNYGWHKHRNYIWRCYCLISKAKYNQIELLKFGFDDVADVPYGLMLSYKLVILSNSHPDIIKHNIRAIGVDFDEVVLLLRLKPTNRIWEYSAL